MKTLWERLKPEHRKTIIKHQESGEWTLGPYEIEKKLKSEYLFTHLPFTTVYELFQWTDTPFIELQWEDYFGDRFLVKGDK